MVADCRLPLAVWTTIRRGRTRPVSSALVYAAPQHRLSAGSGTLASQRAIWTWLALGITALLVAQAGCIRKGQERRFELKGKVVSVDAKSRQVTIAHEPIPGYMPAMTMPYELNDDLALRVAKPGDDISAALVVSGSKAWLEDAVVVEQTVDSRPGGSKPSVRIPQQGEQIPNFSLLNQDGKRMRTEDFRGGPLVLTFVYTRCPLPDYCPLMSARFVELDKDLKNDTILSSKTHLLSITIDPEFDTPLVMRSYGLEYIKQAGDAGFERWQFATGSPDEIASIAKYFGLAYWKENGQITHALVTAVIDSDGKVGKVFLGNNWKSSEVLSELQRLRVD